MPWISHRIIDFKFDEGKILSLPPTPFLNNSGLETLKYSMGIRDYFVFLDPTINHWTHWPLQDRGNEYLYHYDRMSKSFIPRSGDRADSLKLEDNGKNEIELQGTVKGNCVRFSLHLMPNSNPPVVLATEVRSDGNQREMVILCIEARRNRTIHFRDILKARDRRDLGGPQELRRDRFLFWDNWFKKSSAA
jgi:hypothetical protein